MDLTPKDKLVSSTIKPAAGVNVNSIYALPFAPTVIAPVRAALPILLVPDAPVYPLLALVVEIGALTVPKELPIDMFETVKFEILELDGAPVVLPVKFQLTVLWPATVSERKIKQLINSFFICLF